MTKRTEPSWPLPFVAQPIEKHTHTFIFLHGLGSNGEKFGRELLASGISSAGKTIQDTFPGAKFIFPTAKWRRSTAFKRAMLTQWFDMYSLNRSEREDVQIEGLIDSGAYVRDLISKEMEVLPPTNIILGGLSQGCAMSLMALLSLEFPIGAYIGMSGRLPFRNDIHDILSHANAHDDIFMFSEENETETSSPTAQALGFVRDLLHLEERDSMSLTTKNALATPVFMGHGAKDEKVPCGLGEDAAGTLSLLEMDVAWKRYPGLAHWYQVPEEIDDILAFLAQKLV